MSQTILDKYVEILSEFIKYNIYSLFLLL